MDTLHTVEAVAAAIRIKPKQSWHVVGVDGFMDSGKTTLAFELAELLSGIRVGLDCYIDRHSEATNYIDKLRLPYLKSHLERLTSAFPFVVVDGICLLDASDAISRSIDSSVYVKRVSGQGLWHDGFHLQDYESGQTTTDDWLATCELSYHAKRRPHELADFIYERCEA